jgi:DNA polymerase III alpha subunit
MRKTSEKSRNPGCDFCYLAASDNTGAVTNMVCWPEVYEKIKHDLAQDVVATIYGRKESWNGREQIVIFDIKVIG